MGTTKNEMYIDIPGYEGLYEISESGNVRNIKTDKHIKMSPVGKTGFYKVNLLKEGKQRGHYIHRLLAQAYLNMESYNRAGFIDGDKNNIHIDNIEVVVQHTDVVRTDRHYIEKVSETLPKRIFFNHKLKKWFVVIDEDTWFLSKDEIPYSMGDDSEDEAKLAKFLGPFDSLLYARTAYNYHYYEPNF